MTDHLLLYLYIADAALLIVHEMDSAYWKEWEMFRLPGGLSFFLLIHLPLLMAVLYGLAAVAKGESAGEIFSLALSAAGIFAFSIHTWFLRKGRKEFDAPVSKAILWAVLLVSIALGAAALAG